MELAVDDATTKRRRVRRRRKFQRQQIERAGQWQEVGEGSDTALCFSIPHCGGEYKLSLDDFNLSLLPANYAGRIGKSFQWTGSPLGQSTASSSAANDWTRFQLSVERENAASTENKENACCYNNNNTSSKHPKPSETAERHDKMIPIVMPKGDIEEPGQMTPFAREPEAKTQGKRLKKRRKPGKIATEENQPLLVKSAEATSRLCYFCKRPEPVQPSISNAKILPNMPKPSKGKKGKKGQAKAEAKSNKDVSTKSANITGPPFTFVVNSFNEYCWPKPGQKKAIVKGELCTCNFSKQDNYYIPYIPLIPNRNSSDVQANVKDEAGEFKEETRTDILDILLKIINDNGEAMVVRQANWNAVVSSLNIKSAMFCTLCLEGFVGEEGFIEHTSTARHLILTDLPLFGQHEDGIRQISMSLYHCILCNMAIHNVDRHTSTNQHQFNLSKSNRYAAQERKIKSEVSSLPIYEANEATEDEHQPQKTFIPTSSEDVTYYCYKCDTYIPNYARQIVVHKNGIEHKTNQRTYHSKKEVGTISKGTPALRVGASPRNVDPSTFQLLKREEVMMAFEYSSGFCTVCNLDAGKGNLEQHILGRTHRTHVPNATTVGNTVGFAVCVKCCVLMPNHHHSVVYHFEGKQHQHVLRREFEFHCLEDLGERLFCNPCKMSIHRSVFWVHINTGPHRGNLKWYRREPHFCRTCNYNVPGNKRELHRHGKTHLLNVKTKKNISNTH